MTAIGQPLARVDGRLKVTGGAKYAMDASANGQAHAHLVTSTIGRGRISLIDTTAVLRLPGVLAVVTHLNAPRLPYGGAGPELHSDVDPAIGRHLRMLQDDRIHFSGQPIAIVVAETREQAEHAASLVQVAYDKQLHITELREGLFQARAPEQLQLRDPGKSERLVFNQALPGAGEPMSQNARAKPVRGDPSRVFTTAAVKVDALYAVPTEHHNPIGLISTLAEWTGPDQLQLHETTQFTYGAQAHMAWVFGIAPEKVHVVAPFTGGAFGCTLRTWPHSVAAALAAKVVGRPVKLTLTRAQMFTAVGHRPETRNRFRLSATRDGRLTSIEQAALHTTSRYEEFTESETNAARYLYACPNVSTSYRLVPLDIQTPTHMRAPGENTSIFALECAMDELSYALELDPIELRLRNHDFEHDPDDGRPWAANALRECYRQGAERFGWSTRDPRPRSMRAGRMLVGYGVAAATYPTNRVASSASVRINLDGSAEVRSASTDIGVGTYTVLTQIASDALQIPVGRIRVILGDTSLPRAPMQGGSMITASVGAALHEACLAARAQVIAINGGRSTSDYAAVLGRHGRAVTVAVDAKPDPTTAKAYSAHAFGVRFAEVRVGPETGVVHVHRFLSVTDGGRIINPRQARSQMMGGMAMSIGMTLSEATRFDPRNGRITNANLADYAVAVHADSPAFDCIFVESSDMHTTPLGLKGIGEVAAVGVAPAIANAVYHATGKRIRELPITPEKLI